MESTVLLNSLCYSLEVNDSSAAAGSVGGEVALAPLAGRTYQPSGTLLPTEMATNPSALPPVGTRRYAPANGLVANNQIWKSLWLVYLHERTVRKKTGEPNEKWETRIFLNFDETLVNAKIISNTNSIKIDIAQCF